jgi:peroxiredoxin
MRPSLVVAVLAVAVTRQTLHTSIETRTDHLIGDLWLFPKPCERASLRLVKEPRYQSPTPRYGTLPLSSDGIAVVFDVVEGSRPQVYVDANGNRDLTDDPSAPWTEDEFQNLRKPVSIRLAFDAAGPGRAMELPYDCIVPKGKRPDGQVMFRSRFNRTGMLRLKGREYPVRIHTDDPKALYSDPARLVLGIDRNGDGRVDDSRLSGETFSGGTPFHLDGESYRVVEASALGEAVTIEVSATKVPPKHHVVPGEPAPGFEGSALNGRQVSLASLRGKVVLLEFMAAWCQPCIAAIPDTKRLFEEFGHDGLEVVAVSLDEGDASRPALEAVVARNSIPWPVIFDGGGWESPVAKAYNVAALPVHVLVDRLGVVRLVGRSGIESESRKLRDAVVVTLASSPPAR